MNDQPDGRRRIFLISITLGIAVLAHAGCALLQTPSSSRPHTRPADARTQQLKPADARVQQQWYDQGLQHYSKENYGDARKAFQRAVDLGPNTALGQKAQENLRKIQQILKTVEEIESK